MTEAEKRARFIKVGERRVNEILKRLEGLKALGNTRQYQSEPDDIHSMITALLSKVNEVSDTLTKTEASESQFRF